MKPNLFDNLRIINDEKIGSVHVYFSNNLKDVRAGKQGWGEITMAVTTGDAQEIMNGAVSGETTKYIILMVVDKKTYDEQKDRAVAAENKALEEK